MADGDNSPFLLFDHNHHNHHIHHETQRLLLLRHPDSERWHLCNIDRAVLDWDSRRGPVHRDTEEYASLFIAGDHR
jgi:hypothetical protein